MLFIAQSYFTAFGSYGSHNLRLLILIMRLFTLSASSLACFYLVTSCRISIFCGLTLANVLRMFKLSRLSSPLY